MTAGEFAEKMFLFQKILSESTNLLQALLLFRKEDLEELFQRYKVPAFKREYLQRRKDVAEAVLFGRQVDIPALRWREE